MNEQVVSRSEELENVKPANGIPEFKDTQTLPNLADGKTDWSRSYHGLSVEPFPKEVADVLQAPIDTMDIEIKPGVLLFDLISKNS